MRFRSCILHFGLFALLLGGTAATAADAPANAAPGPAVARPPAVPTSEAPGDRERRPAEILPAPLSGVASNVLDLEETGHLAVTSVEFGWSEDFGDESLIWTVKVLKPITCRHAMLLLHRYTDVRFYHVQEKSEKELFSGKLYFSPRIAERAVHGDILQRDTEFQVWLPLTLPQALLLARQQADHIVFHEPQTRRVRPLGASSTQWNIAISKIPRWFTVQQKKDRLSQ
jgi:hypothetical protein